MKVRFELSEDEYRLVQEQFPGWRVGYTAQVAPMRAKYLRIDRVRGLSGVVKPPCPCVSVDEEVDFSKQVGGLPGCSGCGTSVGWVAKPHEVPPKLTEWVEELRTKNPGTEYLTSNDRLSAPGVFLEVVRWPPLDSSEHVPTDGLGSGWTLHLNQCDVGRPMPLSYATNLPTIWIRRRT